MPDASSRIEGDSGAKTQRGMVYGMRRPQVRLALSNALVLLGDVSPIDPKDVRHGGST